MREEKFDPMKRFYILFMLAVAGSLFFYGCSKDDAVDPRIDWSQAGIPVLPYDGGSRTVEFTVNTEWKAAVDETTAAWCGVSPQSGGPGTIQLTVTALPNPDAATRSADIRVDAGGLSKSLAVTQSGFPTARLDQKTYEDIPAAGKTFDVAFETNLDEKSCSAIVQLSDREWISVSTTKALQSRSFTVKVERNDAFFARTGRIVLKDDTGRGLDTVTIRQLAADPTLYYQDGEVVTMQTATEGAVDIVFSGDGFIREDMARDGGPFIRAMEDAIDYFFDVEPYRTYRNYFNVYVVCGISKQQGVSDLNTKKNTVFSVRFTQKEDEGTGMECDANAVFSYMEKAPVDLTECLVVMIANSTRYGGTTISWGDGSAIAMCPMIEGPPPSNFRGVVQHEAGGHGFGKLADEYIYYTRDITSSEIAYLKQWEKYGHNANLDFTDDPAKIKWRHFYSQPGYERVGAYEGGYMCAYGVWRPESNSCMNNNVSYYNSPSREKMVRRIMEQSGRTFDFDEFVEKDAVVLSLPSEIVSPAPLAAQPAVPFAPPVLREGSPRGE